MCFDAPTIKGFNVNLGSNSNHSTSAREVKRMTTIKIYKVFLREAHGIVIFGWRHTEAEAKKLRNAVKQEISRYVNVEGKWSIGEEFVPSEPEAFCKWLDERIVERNLR
jgi:hypothetical protein